MTSETLEQHVADRLHTDGWVILRDFMTPESIAALRKTADRILLAQKRREARDGPEENFGSRRARELLGRHEAFWDCATHPLMTACAGRLLGDGFHIGAAALNEVNPGARAQRLHRDDEHVTIPRPFVRPVVMNTIWALHDFTIESGATRFVSGSHREARPDSETHIAHAEMPAGSVFIFDGSLWHGSSANTSTHRRRVGLVLTYCAAFLRPFENQLRGFSAKRMEALASTRLQLVTPSLDAKLDRRRELRKSAAM